jgi:hypothetical protein
MMLEDTKLFEEHRSPDLIEVKEYFSKKNMNKREAEHFFLFYELKQWKAKNGQLLHNWKALAGKWIAFAIRN